MLALLIQGPEKTTKGLNNENVPGIVPVHRPGLDLCNLISAVFPFIFALWVLLGGRRVF